MTLFFPDQIKRYHYRDLHAMLTSDQKAALPVLDPTQCEFKVLKDLLFCIDYFPNKDSCLLPPALIQISHRAADSSQHHPNIHSSFSYFLKDFF